MLVYSQDAKRKFALQVKALSARDAVPLGTKLDALYGDFFVICRNVAADLPECFILKPDEVRELAQKSGKEGNVSYWLEPKQYAVPEFREKWERIGKGASETLPEASA